MTSTERSPKRFDGYLAELKAALAVKGLASGRASDLVPVADALRAPGGVREELAEAIRSILLRETGGLSRAQVASMLAVAVGGTGLYVTAQEVDAVGRWDEFVDWVMAPLADVSLGADAVAQAVEPFWGIVGAGTGETGGPAGGLSNDILADSEARGVQVEDYPAAAFVAVSKRSHARWMVGAFVALVLLMGGLIWEHQRPLGGGNVARSTEALTAEAQPNDLPDPRVSAAAEAAGQANAGQSFSPASAASSALAATHFEKPSVLKAGEQGAGKVVAASSGDGVKAREVQPASGRGLAPSMPGPTRMAAVPSSGHVAEVARPSRSTVASGAGAAAGVGATGKFVVSSGVMSGHLIAAPEPAYPKMAKMWGVQGEVVLQVVVSRRGRVVAAHAMDGHRLLRGAASNAVKKWRYRPYMTDGKPTDVETVVIVDFHLPS